MASQPETGAVAGGQPGDRLPGPGRYRRKSETVEALHWDGSPVAASVIIGWILGHGGTARYRDDPSCLSIDIPGGTVNAVPGDWVVRRPDGVFWPWVDWEFAAAYEPAGETEPAALRLRDGDQQLPVPNGGPSMHDLVITDLSVWTVPHREAVQDLLLERRRTGLERYGSLLQAGNHRDWYRDLTDELADAAVYAKQGICELADDAPADLGQVYRLILRALSRAVRIPEDGRG